MLLKSLFKISQADRGKFVCKVIDSSSPNADFYFLVFLSSLIVAFGLAANNLILVIGGMLVTPLLSPVLAIALGAVTSEKKLLFRSIKVFLLAVFLSLLISFVLGSIVKVYVYRVDLIALMRPSWFALVIAITAGLAASYSWAKPGLDQLLPGIAITVSLIPPIIALGLVLAEQSWFLFFRVLEFLLINVFGIIAGALIIFILMEFYRSKRKTAIETKASLKQ
ncbi:MAG: TIGR00341 family protein [Candidatus Pacebacteria bacterium]|nr:TIGR00341 family protein [Candidatus Paceibacterota bacterium]